MNIVNETYTMKALLQKAIRRGEADWALHAKNRLAQINPNLLKRIAVCAFEDIGVANPTLVNTIINFFSLEPKKFIGCKQWNDDLDQLIYSMCHSAKCRSADDLQAIATYDIRYQEICSTLSIKTDDELIGLFYDQNENMVHRLIAGAYLLGNTGISSLMPRASNRASLISSIMGNHWDKISISNICKGLNITKCPLPLWYGILLEMKNNLTECGLTSSDNIPSSIAINCKFPSWTFDMFTRIGKTALRKMLVTDCETARWIKDNIEQERQLAAICELHFRIESSLCTHRLSWPLGNNLRHDADYFTCGVSNQNAQVGYKIFVSEMPLLNQLRQEAAQRSYKG